MDFRFVPLLATLLVSMSAPAKTKAVPELKIVQRDGGAKQGDELVIRCTIKNIALMDILQIVRKIDGSETKVVANVYISRQFVDTGRYNVTDHANDITNSERMIELTIKDVQGKDGGDIGCVHLPSELGAFDNVLIHVPVESVDILYQFGEGDNTSYMSASDGDVLRLKQGQLATIICRVKVEGSDFDPIVDVTLDDKDAASGVFVALPPTRNRADEDGFLEMEYMGEWEYKMSEHDVSLNGQNLTCSAKKTGYPAVSKTVAMQVVYEPVLDCAEEHARELGTKQTRIACKARMNPEPETVVWSWGIHPNRTTLMSGEKDGKYAAEHKILGDDHHEFALAIEEITEDDFRKYKLEIANSIGTKEHNLNLLEGDPASVGKQIEKNEANAVLSTALLLATSLLLSLIHAS